MDGFEIIDRRFRRFVLPNAPLERLADGFRWLEGPVWFADMRCLLVSDIPNDRIMRWTQTGGVEVYSANRPAFPTGRRVTARDV
jgi:gluconolactonase